MHKKNDFFRDVICLLKDFEWLSHFVDASASSEYDNNQIMRMWGQAIAHIKSQEFRYLCGQFDGKERGGVETDVSGMPGRDTSRGLECSFASLSGTGTSPGPRKGRGAQRKLNFVQTKLSFEVIRGSAALVRISTNQKRGRNTDSVEGEKGVKKMKVL